MNETKKKRIFQNKIFQTKLVNFIKIDLFSKIANKLVP